MKPFILILSVILLHGCATGDMSEVLQDWESVPNDHARSFQILRKGDDKVLLVFGPGGEADTLGIYLFAKEGVGNLMPMKPLNRIIAATTTHLPYIIALGREERVVGAALLRDVPHEGIRDMAASGRIREVGTADGLDRELLVSLKPDAILDHPFNKQRDAGMDGIPVIHITEYLEEHPLGRAEWLKVFAMLLGREQEGETIYQEIARRYGSIEREREGFSNLPRVFFGSAWQGQWFSPPGNSYMATLIRDAGAEYMLEDARQKGNIALDLEKVLHKVRRADHFGMIVSAPDKVDPLSLCGGEQRLASIPAVTRGGFYGNSATSDLFGQALLEPDVCLRDLRMIFHPPAEGAYQPRYFHPVTVQADTSR